MNCLMAAWHRHEAELRAWLRGRMGNPHDAEDMLQELFPEALHQCSSRWHPAGGLCVQSRF